MISQKTIWTGRVISGAMIAFMLFDAAMHMTRIDPVVQAFAKLGFPMNLAIPLAVVELTCTLLYLYPRTAVLGAILLTGYLGGAVSMHLRVGSSLFGETLFPVYIGILLWLGLYLREPLLHALAPLTETEGSREISEFAPHGAAAPQHR